MTQPTLRQQSVAAFEGVTGVTIAGLRQTGREIDTATFTLVLSDNTLVPIGPAERLWSRAQTSRALAVAAGVTLAQCKAVEYEVAINAVVCHACDIEAHEQDSLAGRVADWLDQYLRGVTPHKERAAPRREPFIDEDYTYVAAGNLTRWIRREYMDSVPEHHIRHALGTLGYSQLAVNYTPDGAKRTSASYYRLPRA